MPLLPGFVSIRNEESPFSLNPIGRGPYAYDVCSIVFLNPPSRRYSDCPHGESTFSQEKPCSQLEQFASATPRVRVGQRNAVALKNKDMLMFIAFYPKNPIFIVILYPLPMVSRFIRNALSLRGRSEVWPHIETCTRELDCQIESPALWYWYTVPCGLADMRLRVSISVSFHFLGLIWNKRICSELLKW